MLYTDIMFETVETMKELKGYAAVEHFRNVPTDMLTPLTPGQKWGERYGNLLIIWRHVLLNDNWIHCAARLLPICTI